MSSNARPAPDAVLTDIADYVTGFDDYSTQACAAARLVLTDSLACAFDALDFPECVSRLEPLVPGVLVPHGARVPATAAVLDPAAAAFNFTCMIRWLDFNDTFTAAQGSHPSDNLGGILMLADYLCRSGITTGRPPLTMADVLRALIQAYEIQGGLAIENDLKQFGIDHALFTRAASAAVLTRMLGGTREHIINAVSNAFMDTPLVAFRQSPNTGWRKSWETAETIAQAMRLAFMAVRGEMGYPAVLTAKRYGLYDARFGGQPFRFQRPYGDYVIRNSMFKLVTAGMHSQSAVEAAFQLHPLVAPRLDDIARIEIHTQRALMSIMNKSGPLHNPADRDHCVQYIIAVALINGFINPRDFEDEFAADPRIDALREKTVVSEDARYTAEFYQPDKRSSANSVQVFFRDGSSTPKVEIEYPAGHPRRRAEALPLLQKKFEGSLARKFPAARCGRIVALCADPAALDSTPVSAFVDLVVP